MMRIITGKARGVRLETKEGDSTRPTSERAKEAVFSMLQFEIEDRRVLDLFAGSGQLGLEAVSRGAKSAVLVDSSREAADVIQRNANKTRLAPDCEVFCSDASAFLRSCRGKRRFDLVFLDPPYALGLIPGALRQMTKYGLLPAGSTVVCESAAEGDVFGGDERLQSFFEVLRAVRYGAAFVTVLRLKEEAGV